MIFEDVTDHEDSLMLGGQIDELLSLGRVKCKRFFDVYVLTVKHGRFSEAKMFHGRRGDGDGIDAGILQHFVEALGGAGLVFSR